MNMFLLDLALASTVSAAWIPIGHGPSESSKDAVASAAIPTIADADLDPEFNQPMRTTRTSPVLPTDIVSDFDPEFGQPMRTTRTYQPPVVHTSLASDFDPEFGQPMRTTRTYESAVVPTINVTGDTVILRPIQSTKTFEVPVETLTSIVYVPGPCNTGSCHPSFTTKTVLVPTGAPAPTASSGCSPACPSLCPPAHLPRPIPSHPHRPVPVPTGNNHPEYHNTTYPEPRPIEGRFWRIKDLSRHCAKDGKSCDYEFAIEADGKTEHCNINRKPGSDAALESWTNVPCNKKSHKTVSWGYVTEPAPAFAVVTVVEGKVLAWFGVADINGQKVTSSNPFGSGHYGNLGPDQVYTY
ncbi:hypothetical protein HYE68_011115 [Fusarium pseudograminearum]|nr:hypothetical protein HYE68_011115 [Fusarium pseudograminearum]